MPISETYHNTFFQLWTGIVKMDDTKWLIIKNVRGEGPAMWFNQQKYLLSLCQPEFNPRTYKVEEESRLS